MERPVEEIHKLKYPGAVDADGHILESAKCWEEYCEPKYRANAIRMNAPTVPIESPCGILTTRSLKAWSNSAMRRVYG